MDESPWNTISSFRNHEMNTQTISTNFCRKQGCQIGFQSSLKTSPMNYRLTRNRGQVSFIPPDLLDGSILTSLVQMYTSNDQCNALSICRKDKVIIIYLDEHKKQQAYYHYTET